jgi:hypothetical protein
LPSAAAGVAWTGEHNGTTEVLVGVEKDGVGAVAVASVHLDAGSEDKRVQLLGATLAAARARMGGGRNLRVIVAGDMNAEFKVGSALGAVVSLEDGDAADARRECAVALRHEPDDAELEAWAELRRIARFDVQKTLRRGLLGRVPTGPTRCGYDHEVPNSTVMRAWSLDHLLYSPATLAPVARWATLEADAASLASGLPNAAWPSDHLPVAAAFSVAYPSGPLSEAAQEGLRRLAHAEADANAAFDVADADDAAADAAEKPPKGGGKKQRQKCKPTPEAIERKRRRRKRRQDHDAALAARRAEFVATLVAADYDALEARALRNKREHHKSCAARDALEEWAAGTWVPVDDAEGGLL